MSNLSADIGKDVTTRSWDEIVRSHSATVYRLSYRLTGNPHDAGDLTQDVFLQLFRAFPQPVDGGLEPWLRRVTTNRFIDQLRRRRRITFETLTDHAGEQLPSREPTPPQVFSDRTIDDGVRRGLEALTPGIRAAVVLRDIEGLTHSEVASTLGIGVKAARSRICRGRAQLRNALTGDASPYRRHSPVRASSDPRVERGTPPGTHTGAIGAAPDQRGDGPPQLGIGAAPR